MRAQRERVFVDHYAILGIHPAATAAQVKASFRALAKTHHPDRGGDSLRFREVYTSYRVLRDETSRAEFDERYRSSVSNPRRRRKVIPSARLIFPTSMAVLAARGLLRRQVSSSDRRRHLKVDYDVVLPLTPQEWRSDLSIAIPVVVRAVCPDCRGSDIHCWACNGKGSHKVSRNIRIDIDGGVIPGQVLEVPLRGLRPGQLSHFKKQSIRVRVVKEEPQRHDGTTIGRESS